MSAALAIPRAVWEQMSAAARAAAPQECCGLLGGRAGAIGTLYPLRNVARYPLVAYEAAAEDLFAAQRRMRAGAEQLVGIYHSHPRAVNPVPSAVDVKMAFYPSAVYFIIGLGGQEPTINAFRLFEAQGRWERAAYEIIDGAHD